MVHAVPRCKDYKFHTLLKAWTPIFIKILKRKDNFFSPATILSAPQKGDRPIYFSMGNYIISRLDNQYGC